MQADLDQDPNVLWIMIRETHLTAVHGVGLGALELVQLKNKFGQLRQKPGASIGEFKKEFDLVPVLQRLPSQSWPCCFSVSWTHSAMLLCLRTSPTTLPSAVHFRRPYMEPGLSHRAGRQRVPRLLEATICTLCSFLPTKSQVRQDMQLGEDRSKQDVDQDDHLRQTRGSLHPSHQLPPLPSLKRQERAEDASPRVTSTGTVPIIPIAKLLKSRRSC